MKRFNLLLFLLLAGLTIRAQVLPKLEQFSFGAGITFAENMQTAIALDYVSELGEILAIDAGGQMIIDGNSTELYEVDIKVGPYYHWSKMGYTMISVGLAAIIDPTRKKSTTLNASWQPELRRNYGNKAIQIPFTLRANFPIMGRVGVGGKFNYNISTEKDVDNWAAFLLAISVRI